MKKRILSIIMAVCLCVTAFATFGTDNVSAASKQISKSNYTMYSSGGFKALDVYGKDTITWTYDAAKNKITTSKASQSSKNLGTKICEAAGIKCIQKTSSYHKYQSVWYLNFDVMPKQLDALCVAVGINPGLFRAGRIMKVTTTYTITAKGTMTQSLSAKAMFPSKYSGYYNKVKKLFSI